MRRNHPGIALILATEPSYVSLVRPIRVLFEDGLVGRNQLGLLVLPRQLLTYALPSVQPHFAAASGIIDELKNLVAKVRGIGVTRVERRRLRRYPTFG